MVDALIGARQPAHLAIADFPANPEIAFLVRLLRAAVANRDAGINVLIYGPPGTGKTELARALAAEAQAVLHGVGEADDDGDEPDRNDRIEALRLAQRLLGQAGGKLLLFDEMEDLIGDTQPSRGDWFTRRSGSKIFVNRMLETNRVPVIWTTNAIGNVDRAILRRMSFVLEMGLPSRTQAQRMMNRVAQDEGTIAGPAINQLLDIAPEVATVLRVATRAGRIAAEADVGALSAVSLVTAMRRGNLPPVGPGSVDVDLLEADVEIRPLFDTIVQRKLLDVSLLLSGPPGTGKTCFAHQLARALDRPLVVKRASDLLSKWVGETEQAIAGAFAEARDRQGVLLFDEVDSLLFDRSAAKTNWEVGQVNEMLTWLDSHPFPVIAATNRDNKLDPAALRRFVFKVELRVLSPDRAARAFEYFFQQPAPESLFRLTNLSEVAKLEATIAKARASYGDALQKWRD